MSMVQLVVSKLVTNARKYAPGPCLLTLEINGGAIEVTVWGSTPTPPAILAPDPDRPAWAGERRSRHPAPPGHPRPVARHPDLTDPGQDELADALEVTVHQIEETGQRIDGAIGLVVERCRPFLVYPTRRGDS
ncbi:hypothetical protein [Streptomyces sp. NPDC005209]|uniref:hypothetical protein n=1 Tax=Streptomyces sp. NPDC005209 TaxID=3156715 RepID=UPI0033BFAA19